MANKEKRRDTTGPITGKEEQVWVVASTLVLEPSELETINFFNTFIKEKQQRKEFTIKIVNFNPGRANPVERYLPSLNPKVVICKASILETFMAEVKGKTIIYIDALDAIINEGNLNNLKDYLMGDTADDEESAVQPKKKQKSGNGGHSEEEPYRKSILKGTATAEIITINESVKSKNKYNLFQKFIIIVLRSFIEQENFQYENNAMNIVIHHLLMLNYDEDNSIIKSKYNFPFLTPTNITDIIKGVKATEKKKILRAENDVVSKQTAVSQKKTAVKKSTLEIITDEILSNFKNSESQNLKISDKLKKCPVIASQFSEIGFKDVSVKFNKERGFILQVSDFNHEEFHQDHEDLKESFRQYVVNLTTRINRIYNPKE